MTTLFCIIILSRRQCDICRRDIRRVPVVGPVVCAGHRHRHRRRRRRRARAPPPPDRLSRPPRVGRGRK